MIEIDGASLTLEEFAAVATGRERTVRLAAAARGRMAAARQVIAEVAAGSDPVYGVNTGFGDLAKVRVSPEQLRLHQERLLLSHAAGMGEPLPD